MCCTRSLINSQLAWISHELVAKSRRIWHKHLCKQMFREPEEAALSMTECTQSSFEFSGAWSRSVVARFDGGKITSDGGGLLLREVDRRIGLLNRLSECFQDGRSQSRVRHSVREMVAQRVYGLALGYEDLNDHEQLREDPLVMLLAGSADAESALAGKSTLNRLELAGEAGAEDRYKRVHYDADAIDSVLVAVFLEAHAQPPQEIVIDLDTTDLPLHGHQEQRFFHGFYYHYCYLPLYIICGEHLLRVRLGLPISMPAPMPSKR